jgi:hypothetical protein
MFLLHKEATHVDDHAIKVFIRHAMCFLLKVLGVTKAWILMKTHCIMHVRQCREI